MENRSMRSRVFSRCLSFSSALPLVAHSEKKNDRIALERIFQRRTGIFLPFGTELLAKAIYKSSRVSHPSVLLLPLLCFLLIKYFYV